jgi:hypothetical protein
VNTQPEPFRYVDEDGFCLSARLLPNLNTGGVTDTLSITVEGDGEPQSAHVSAADVERVVAAIRTAAGQPAPATDRDALRDRIRKVLAAANGFSFADLEPHNYRKAADAVLSVLPEPADRATVLDEAADALAARDPATAPLVGFHARGEDVALLRRMAAEARATEPDTGQDETDEEREDRLETERAHAEGEHAFCGPTCEAEFPSDKLRNTILCRALPGSAGMLDELLRRAAAQPAADESPEIDRLNQINTRLEREAAYLRAELEQARTGGHDTATELLRSAESYLSALHGSVARHDNLGADFTCAGCELRDQIGAQLRRVAETDGAQQ